MDYKKYDAQEVITRIADAADAFAWQAGVGAMETAGALLGYLAKYPKDLEPFMVGGIFELPNEFITMHDLSWHTHGGKVVSPDEYRRSKVIADMAKGNGG